MILMTLMMIVQIKCVSHLTLDMLNNDIPYKPSTVQFLYNTPPYNTDLVIMQSC